MREDRLYAQARLAVQAQSYAEFLKEEGRLKFLADDPDCPDLLRLAALTEEVGEVARCVHDGNTSDLAIELAQTAGVALAWLAALDGP